MLVDSINTDLGCRMMMTNGDDCRGYGRVQWFTAAVTSFIFTFFCPHTAACPTPSPTDNSPTITMTVMSCLGT